MGTFDALAVGTSGLFAARRGVETAGQNIANLNTKGYSRQRVDVTPDTGPVQPAIFSNWTGVGRGIRSTEVTRLRDQFLDRRAREESSENSYLEEIESTYASIERVFGEPSDTGLAAVTQDFLSSFDDVGNQPSDQPARVQVIEKGVTLATNIRSLEDQLTQIGAVNKSKLDSVISEVNSTARQVADIQFTVRSATASGLNVNELLDQRDVLLAQIADKVGGKAQYEDDGTVTFFIGSRALVRGDKVDALQLADVGTASEIQWAADGRPAQTSGQAQALQQSVNETIPAQIQALHDVRDTLMADINAQHTAGFDLNGAAGLDFFTMGLDGIEVNATIQGDPDLIAATDTAGTLGGANALLLAEQTASLDLYRESIVTLGVQSQASIRRSDLQQAVVEQVDLENESVHGVNLDEELTDLVRYQRAYEANSRFISTVDNLLDVLVNRTGV